MALTKNKNVFIDFTKEPGCPVFAKTTNAVATAADNQEDYCWVGGNKYIEWIQTGAWTALMPGIQTTAPFGWMFDLDATNGDGLEMTMGMAASSSAGTISFTVGTDAAFFCRMKATTTTLANHDVVACGFRELAAYTDITDPAGMGSVYDEKAAIAVDDNAGAVVSHFSTGATPVDTQTTATGTPIVTAQAFEFMVRISAAGVASYYIALDADTTPLGTSPTADVLLSVPTQTIATGTVLVPYIVQVGTGTATDFVLQEWEVGYV